MTYPWFSEGAITDEMIEQMIGAPMRIDLNPFNMNHYMLVGEFGDYVERRINPMVMLMLRSADPAVAMEARRNLLALAHDAVLELRQPWRSLRSTELPSSDQILAFWGYKVVSTETLEAA